MGRPAPASLPTAVDAAVREVEAEVASTGVDTAHWGWTLTFLEGRPIVDLDDGTRILYLPNDDRAIVVNAGTDTDDETDGPAAG